MAEFKIKNLMIDVVAADKAKLGELCLFPTKYCRFLSIHCPKDTYIVCDWITQWCKGQTLDCMASCFVSGGCGVNYSTCWNSELFMIDIKQLVINPDEINVLRDQLDEVFKAVEVRALEVEADMAPKNLEQAEYVESQLQNALKHVQNLKRKMGQTK